MPKHKVLLIGAGPIIIGQGCEFDYSGTQACKTLHEEGCQVVLINSNPATIMTDPNLADATYIEPLTLEVLEKVIAKERPDSLLASMGGQTALNLALQLGEKGILDKYDIRVIGSSLHTIACTENRERFKQVLKHMGLPVLQSYSIISLNQLKDVLPLMEYPLIVRCSYTLGGHGGGIAWNEAELLDLYTRGLAIADHGILIEESILGWKEYELEILRDRRGNGMVVCGIENIDPVGVHTGDSITVTPIQTLTDKEYQQLRRCAFSILENIAFEAGACNVQFAVHPNTGEFRCIEINPRASRSSAMASKATGFPIAKAAVKLALGYQLNDLNLVESREPSLDYIVVKIPHFDFHKFPEANQQLTTSMKSVGEVMSFGRTFKEALQKAMTSLEIERPPLPAELETALSASHPDKLGAVFEALRQAMPLDKIQRLTHYDAWFLQQIKEIVDCENEIAETPYALITQEQMTVWKQQGFSDKHLAHLLGTTEEQLWRRRVSLQVFPSYKHVDPSAGESASELTTLYSTYGEACEAKPLTRSKVIVLGSGANRIGQGIEFDYCCVHAVQAIRSVGYEALLVNCNPSTVSTDSDVSDKLYFEPLTVEHVDAICRTEQPMGLIVQCGGQTPLNLVKGLHERGWKILGTSLTALERAANRDQFRKLLQELSIPQPHNGTYCTSEEAYNSARRLGYPVLIRPSHIIGGNAIRLIHDLAELQHYLERYPPLGKPFLMEQFLQGGIEVEVDAIADGNRMVFCGIVEHIDPVGIHSGDSICSLAPIHLPGDIQSQLLEYTSQLGKALHIVGLFNVQFAVVDDTIYVLEVNPRASRTIPLLSKITSIPFVQMATRCMLGETLGNDPIMHPKLLCCAVKVPVFPFDKLPGSLTSLGPQMVSTGEALGIGRTYEEALYKVGSYLNQSIRLSQAGQQQLGQIPPHSPYDVYALQNLYSKKL